jgi:hypothetical protein
MPPPQLWFTATQRFAEQQPLVQRSSASQQRWFVAPHDSHTLPAVLHVVLVAVQVSPPQHG